MNRVCATITVVMAALSSASFAAEPVQVQINIHPGSDPNSIKSTSKGVVPIAVLGSPSVDVTAIDPYSLVLSLNNNLVVSSGVDPVEGGESRPEMDRSGGLLCHIDDIGSYDTDAFDELGDADGFDDLVCQFTKEISLILGVEQGVSLEGFFYSGVAFYGEDLAAEPTHLDADVVCCIVCEGEEPNQTCSGCNDDINPCTDELRACDTRELSEASGCERPRVADGSPRFDWMLACKRTGP